MRNHLVAISGAVLMFGAACSWSGRQSGFAASQSARRASPPRGVLSQNKLKLPLNAPILQVRFSPNGSFILLQDEAGVRVLARQPLSLRLTISARDVLPAHFSADSQYVDVVTPGLNSVRYDLTLGTKVSEKAPLAPEGCLASAISSDGELAACFDPEFHLTVFRIASRETILSETVGLPPPKNTPIPVPRGTQSTFPEPFGYLYAASMKEWVDRRDYGSTMAFSTDNRFVLVRHSNGDASAVDISSRRKIIVTDALKKHLGNAWCFVGPDRVVVLNPTKESDSAVMSFPAGEVLARLPAAGSGVTILSQPRYIRIDPGSFGSADENAPRVFDLEASRFLEYLPKGAADIFQDLAAIYLGDAKVGLYKLGITQPSEEFTVPINPLPPLRTAVVSPNLDYLAVSVRGAGAIYRVASGEQVAMLPQMNGAWFANEETLFVRSNEPGGSSRPVQKLDIKSHSTAQAWSEEKFIGTNVTNRDLRSSGPALLIAAPDASRQIPYSTASLPAPMGPTQIARSGRLQTPIQAYVLRALNMENGKKLWARDFLQDSPVPFADPQGERVVLAWAARSESGRSEATRISRGTQHPRPSTLTDPDVFFEVLDARTGKIIGGALAQFGGGPESFDGAYSVGDSLILSKDGVRIRILSLLTGGEVARLRGTFSSASERTNLLAAADLRRLNLYDLKSGAKYNDFLFPENISYTHFSADGTRVLVLTTNQTVYVLDVKPAAASSATTPGN